MLHEPTVGTKRGSSVLTVGVVPVRFRVKPSTVVRGPGSLQDKPVLERRFGQFIKGEVPRKLN